MIGNKSIDYLILVFSCRWGREDQPDSPRKHNKKAMILGNHQISDITKKWKIFLKIVKIYKKWDILKQTI